MTQSKASDFPACLLTYQFTSDPSPIQVSTSVTSANALIDVSLLNGGKTIYCNKVTIYIPIGETASDLTEKLPSISPNTKKWAVGSGAIIKGNRSYLDSLKDYAQFNCTCKDEQDYLINYDLAFSVSISDVNQCPGEFAMKILENSGMTPDANSFEERFNTYNLEKNPPQFYLKNFVSSKKSTKEDLNESCGQFRNREPFILSWQSNGTNFKVLTTPDNDPVYEGPATSIIIKDGVTDTTTFMLIASVTGGENNKASDSDYETVYLYDAITVKITNPDIVPNKIDVAHGINAGGDVKISADLECQNLKVLKEGHFTCIKTDADLEIGGPLIANNSIDVNGLLHAKESAIISNARFVGDFNARSTTVNMFEDIHTLGSGKKPFYGVIKPHTDGFILCSIDAPRKIDKMSCACASIGLLNDEYTLIHRFDIDGGSTGTFGKSWDKSMSSNKNSMCIPVQANKFLAYSADQLSSNQENSNVKIHFVPMGHNSSYEKPFEIISDSLEGIDPLPSPFAQLAKREKDRKTRATDFITKLEEAFKTPIENGTKAELAKMLLDI